MTATQRVTGHLKVVQRREGPVFYIRSRVPGREPVQTTERLGPRWTGKGRPPAGHYTAKTAKDALGAYLAAARQGTLAGARVKTGHTFADAVAEWLRYCEVDKKRARSTVVDYRNTAHRSLLPAFGADTPLAKITADDVDEFRDELTAGHLSDCSARKIMVLLHGVFARAKRKGWIAENPASEVEKVTLRGSDEFNVLEPDQVTALAQAAGPLGPFFTVAAFTGLRCPGELTALRWEHVDFANRIVHVVRNYVLGAEGQTKGKRRRSVPMSDQALVALDKLSRREHFTAPGDLVFCTPTGVRLSGERIRDTFYLALDAAGLGHLRHRAKPITPYDCRHTFGSLAVRVASLADVQAWLGHQHITTTMRYVHHVPQHGQAAQLTQAFTPEQMPTVSRTVARNAAIPPELSDTERTRNR
jgi:integrase